MKRKIPTRIKFRGAIYTLAAREVTLDDLDEDTQKIVLYFMSQHKDVQPGTPTYNQLLQEQIQRVLQYFPSEHPVDKVLF